MASGNSFAIIGGHPALDFANTAGWHAGDNRVEHLTSYEEWLAWLRRYDHQLSARATPLAREAARYPARASRALRDIIVSRELVFRIFTAIAHRRSPSPADLESLHLARVSALSSAEPRWERGRLTLHWKEASADLRSPLHPILLAASDLLTAPEIGRLRQCANHPCGWLFLDQSKNGSRRWCSSADCGNLTRVRKFRVRQSRES